MYLATNPSLKQRTFFYGADYNPDQWLNQPEIIDEDFSLMREMGCTSMSIGIFAWTSYQPDEASLTFDWLDRIMDRLAKNGMCAFLATPSASKPMWLSEQYPEIRRVDANGLRQRSGGRHNHCPTSPIYREKVNFINRALAERYAKHPALALWHIGNELNGDCHCELCRTAFHEWLRKRYGSLDALNDAWWSPFWNHSFTSWNQIQTIDPSIDALALDWQRFVNAQHVSFLQNEMAPLREVTPDIPCTTNFMGTNDATDYHLWAKHMDVISNDCYPLAADRADCSRQALKIDFTHSLMRGLAQGKPWMLMESSPSSVNWGRPANKLKRPGVHLQECLQAVANGADTIHYFQWRKGLGGSEKFHGAVIDHEGSNHSRVFRECRQVGNQLTKLKSVVGQSTPASEVAIIYDWESKWALQASHGPKSVRSDYPYPLDLHTQACHDHFQALSNCALQPDIISKEDDFSKRKVIITPSLFMISKELAERLISFTNNGGIWIASYLSGYVDGSNRCWRNGFPGPDLRKHFGIWNEEVDYLFDDESVEVIPKQGNSLGLNSDGVGIDVAEILQLEGAEAIAVAGSQFYSDAPIITCNNDSSYYLSSRIDSQLLTDFYRQLCLRHSLEKILPISLPEGVALRRRNTNNGYITFLFNYNRKPISIDLGGFTFTESITGNSYAGNTTLPAYASLQMPSPSDACTPRAS